MNKNPKRPRIPILPGHDRNATDQGHRHYHADELGPDTVINNWEGTSEIDTYEGPNRSPEGDTDAGHEEYIGEEAEEEL